MYKEKIRAIMEANKDDPEILDFTESRVNSFVDYVQYVTFMDIRVQRMQAEGIRFEEWRDKVADMDSHRRSKHEVAISAVNQLNRLAAASGLPLFYEGIIDDAHRHEIGDMCQAVVDEYFEGRDARLLSVDNLMDNGKDFAQEISKLSGQDNFTGLST